MASPKQPAPPPPKMPNRREAERVKLAPAPPPAQPRPAQPRPQVSPSPRPMQPTRGGTPISVKDAPGYRGAGTPPMSPPQISRPAPQAMVDAVKANNAGKPLPPAAPGLKMSGMGMKKGGSVRYEKGGEIKKDQEPPIPKATQDSMRLQAAQEKADRQQKKEQEAGEKEVKENMGRKFFVKGGSVSSASKRADGCCVRGKTRA